MELLNDANRRMLGSRDILNPNTGELVNGDPIPVPLLAEVERDLVLLLAPFAPYLAHELWEMLGEKGNLLKAAWPKYDAALAKEEEIEIPVQVNGKLRSRVIVSLMQPKKRCSKGLSPTKKAKLRSRASRS